MTGQDLQRFVTAQETVHEQVARELDEGRKRSHWMWFVFPQLAGLGHSAMAQAYAIDGLDQARRYLADPLLGGRLRANVQRLLGHRGKTAHSIFGSPDDMKFRSCLTLFAAAASEESDRALFRAALDAFCDGMPDPCTEALLSPS